jgi:hypothetical protein
MEVICPYVTSVCFQTRRHCKLLMLKMILVICHCLNLLKLLGNLFHFRSHVIGILKESHHSATNLGLSTYGLFIVILIFQIYLKGV